MKNRNKKLCKWLRSEVVNDNIKSTLECTIDTLYEICNIKGVTRPEQGAIVENFLTFAEKALYNFLVKHEKKISEKVVKNFAANQTPPINHDFRDADVRHKNAHGVVEDNKRRWCDLDLKRVVHLTCKVVACLGSDYKEAYTAKEEFENEIHRRWTNRPMKNISEIYNQSEDETDLDQMTDFILNALKKVKENNVGDKQKIMQLSLEENESLMKIWRTAQLKITN
ncbi:4704_t:CDS:2 [Gigaspora margarita]|uniref:4704_t:CDS:1 n=1 Tax=Gigaspora margarita TaxID=4874 RepID=A0ABM8VZE6_GIGMA|nr:4704_t:CDS:2 [Gigaspora margarita]